MIAIVITSLFEFKELKMEQNLIQMQKQNVLFCASLHNFLLKKFEKLNNSKFKDFPIKTPSPPFTRLLISSKSRGKLEQIDVFLEFSLSRLMGLA